MKRILCYGDSNTWGYTPGSGCRKKQTHVIAKRAATRQSQNHRRTKTNAAPLQ